MHIMQDDFSDIMHSLSENARFSLQKADFYSKKYNKGDMGTDYLLLGILAMDASRGAKLLESWDVNLDRAEKALGRPAVDIKAEGQMAMMSLSESTILTLQMARNFVRDEGLEIIGTEHLLYALISQQNSNAATLLEKMDVDLDKLAEEIEKLVDTEVEEYKFSKEKQKYSRKSPLKWLSRSCSYITEMARTGKLDNVIGRDKEIERTITVLCRRTTSNPD